MIKQLAFSKIKIYTDVKVLFWKPLSGQSLRMTPLGCSVSVGQVSRFYGVKS